MDKKLYINLLHKILFCFKFRNNEKFDEYKTIVFSPLYKDLFEETRIKMFDLDEQESNKKIYAGNIKDHPEEFKRIITIIEGSDFSKDLSLNVKKELINIVVFPFTITEEDEEYLLKFFPN